MLPFFNKNPQGIELTSLPGRSSELESNTALESNAALESNIKLKRNAEHIRSQSSHLAEGSWEFQFQAIINNLAYFNSIKADGILDFIKEQNKTAPGEFERKFKEYVKHGNNLNAVCDRLVGKSAAAFFYYSKEDPSFKNLLEKLANNLWDEVNTQLSEQKIPVTSDLGMLG